MRHSIKFYQAPSITWVFTEKWDCKANSIAQYQAYHIISLQLTYCIYIIFSLKLLDGQQRNFLSQKR